MSRRQRADTVGASRPSRRRRRFHLFIEAGTGRDALLQRVGPTGYRLDLVTPPGPHELVAFQLPVTIGTDPAPLLNADAAVARLNRLGSRFLLFLNADTCRGAVLYRRYDGHYGLITPSGEESRRSVGDE